MPRSELKLLKYTGQPIKYITKDLLLLKRRLQIGLHGYIHLGYKHHTCCQKNIAMHNLWYNSKW